MNWSEYYMGFAIHAAQKAKHTTKVGAVLVGEGGEIRLTAYNGPPRGVEDTPDRITGSSRYLWHSHAEANLVAFAAREGIRTSDCTVYVTHHPCASCARTLIQADVAVIVYGGGTTSMPNEEFVTARQMLLEAGVAVVPFNEGEQ